ncbi:MAG: hypothetical protein IKZ21_00595 [Clostridia bacterium]|nr:hypothetical protein [Clostridia bacterium]
MTYDPARGEGTLRFTEADTRALPANQRVFLDTRIRFLDGTVPDTDILEFAVTETLFGAEDAFDNGI